VFGISGINHVISDRTATLDGKLQNFCLEAAGTRVLCVDRRPAINFSDANCDQFFQLWRPHHVGGMLILSLSICVVCSSLFGMFVLQTGSVARKQLITSGATCVALLISIQLMFAIRHVAMCNVIERARPLIAAITAFEKKRGKLPKALAELVPEYLPSVPKTGLPAYVPGVFNMGNDPSDTYHYEAPYVMYIPWRLTVEVPIYIATERLIYNSTKEYREEEGQHIERMGDWGYETFKSLW
jgi:hypothetical protein